MTKGKRFISVLIVGLLMLGLFLPGIAVADQAKDPQKKLEQEKQAVQGPSEDKGEKNDNKNKEEKKNQEKIRQRTQLKDVEGHWAQRHIERLNLEGVIKGYNDGSFQPNKPVQQVEVVVMVVNALGWEEEAQARMKEKLPFTNAASVPSWAVGHVAVALEEGLIDSSKFQPNKAASRITVITILVKALGIEPADNLYEAVLDFNDVADLDKESKEYLILGVLNELIKGYEDKTFKPNKPVTRAEMATLLGLLEERLGSCPINGRVNGILVAVNTNQSKITIIDRVYADSTESNDKTVEYRVIDGAAVYRNDGSATLADLKIGDRLIVLLNAYDEVVYIDAKEAAVDQNYLRGEVTEIDLDRDTLELLRFSVVKVKYPLANEITVVINDVRKSIEDIKVGDFVKVLFNDKGEIVKIIK